MAVVFAIAAVLPEMGVGCLIPDVIPRHNVAPFSTIPSSLDFQSPGGDGCSAFGAIRDERQTRRNRCLHARDHSCARSLSVLTFFMVVYLASQFAGHMRTF